MALKRLAIFALFVGCVPNTPSKSDAVFDAYDMAQRLSWSGHQLDLYDMDLEGSE